MVHRFPSAKFSRERCSFSQELRISFLGMEEAGVDDTQSSRNVRTNNVGSCAMDGWVERGDRRPSTSVPSGGENYHRAVQALRRQNQSRQGPLDHCT